MTKTCLPTSLAPHTMPSSPSSCFSYKPATFGKATLLPSGKLKKTLRWHQRMDLIVILGWQTDFIISVFLTEDGNTDSLRNVVFNKKKDTTEKVKYACHPLWHSNAVHIAALWTVVSLFMTKQMVANLKGSSWRPVRLCPNLRGEFLRS